MDAYLARIGSSPASLKRQIRGELSWQRLLRRNVQPFINVSDEEVNEVLERLRAAKGTEEYRLGEIYLAATPETTQTVGDNARRIVEQLRQGGSFVAYARQYSQASTAAVGGDLGWIRLAQLPGELATVARELSPGQLVGPVEVTGGYSILYLIDKRQVLTADPRDAILSAEANIARFPGQYGTNAGKVHPSSQASSPEATRGIAGLRRRRCGGRTEPGCDRGIARQSGRRCAICFRHRCKRCLGSACRSVRRRSRSARRTKGVQRPRSSAAATMPQDRRTAPNVDEQMANRSCWR